MEDEDILGTYCNSSYFYFCSAFTPAPDSTPVATLPTSTPAIAPNSTSASITSPPTDQNWTREGNLRPFVAAFMVQYLMWSLYSEMEKAAEAVSANCFYSCAIFWFFKQIFNGFCLFCAIFVIFASFGMILTFFAHILCDNFSHSKFCQCYFFRFFHLCLNSYKPVFSLLSYITTRDIRHSYRILTIWLRKLTI